MFLMFVYVLFHVNFVLVCGKYNVLFIIVDDLRPSLGIYKDSNAYSPNIDALAEKSTIFKKAFAQQALCAPSRNSLLTSRRPDTLHLYDFYNYWRHTVGDFVTIPQHFKNNGYVTYSVGKVFHPGKSSNYTDDYPLSWTYPAYHPPTEEYKNAKVCLNESAVYGSNIVCPVRVEVGPGRSLPDLQILDEAVQFLSHHKEKAKPYFLGVGFHKPHVPLKYPRHYLDYHPIEAIQLPHYRSKPASMPTVAYNPWNDMRLRDDIQNLELDYPFEKIPDSYAQTIIQSYSAAVTYIDDLVGKLLKHVNLENTVVVFLGDHGVSMGEHGQFSKYSNFDIATRVPLMFHIPEFTQNMLVFNKPVELLDIFPTLVDITALSGIPTCLKNLAEELCTEGKNLLPEMVKLKIKAESVPVTSVPNKRKEFIAISQYPRPGVYPTVKPDSDKPKLKDIKIMGYSIRTTSFRYTEWVGFDAKTVTANWSNVYARELYNHGFDPDENMNLAELVPLNGIMKDLRHKMLKKLGYK